MSRKSWYALGGVLALLCAAVAFRLRGEEDPELCAALAQRRIVQVYVASGAGVRCQGIATQPPGEALRAALRGSDAGRAAALLTAQKGAALALEAATRGGEDVLGRLATFEHLSSLRAVALGPQRALSAPYREPDLALRERDALAYVARALLHGAREPALSSFPPALRRVERVEVMVLLRERGEARLWRSARGTSIARALLTATRVARERWREREAAMGGPLSRRLLELDVEVSLLSEDGVLLGREPSFVDRAISAEHGLGFEYKSGWHYLLPEDVQRRGSGSAQRALMALLNDQGLSPAVLGESALRLYRFVALMLGVSKAPLTGSDAAPPKPG